MGNKNLRRLRCLVTAQTMGNLERLAAMDGCGDVGRMVDKLTREKMLSLRRPVEDWKRHYVGRFGGGWSDGRTERDGPAAPEDGGYHRRPELSGLRL